MKVDIRISNGFESKIVSFEFIFEAYDYAKRAIKNDSNEFPQKIMWIGKDQMLHYANTTDWYEVLAVLDTL